MEASEIKAIDQQEACAIFCKKVFSHFFLLLTFQSILIGVAGFWGGVFCMGLLYLLAVLTKRVFKPEEAEKIAE